MITLAAVGVGGWGKNLARNYYEIPDCRLKYLCDTDLSRAMYPRAGNAICGGLRVVKVLAAARRSIHQNGMPVAIGSGL